MVTGGILPKMIGPKRSLNSTWSLYWGMLDGLANDYGLTVPVL